MVHYDMETSDKMDNTLTCPGHKLGNIEKMDMYWQDEDMQVQNSSVHLLAQHKLNQEIQ